MDRVIPLSLRRAFGLWCLLFAAILAATAASMHWLDRPLALYFVANVHRLNLLGAGLSSSILIAGEMAVIIGLAVMRIARGRLPKPGKALLLACCASLCAFAVNDDVLKVIFGRPNPAQFLFAATQPHFHFLQGSRGSSFPSGHMVMAGAFAFAMARIYPRTLAVFVGLLCLAGALLVVGDWHFLGDVLAGVFIGGTAGFVAGELWIEHVQRHGEID
jgi:membrane-associated phospholipid phosphatase